MVRAFVFTHWPVEGFQMMSPAQTPFATALLRTGKKLLRFAAIGVAIAAAWIGLVLLSDWTSSLLPTDVSGRAKLTAAGIAMLFWMQYQYGKAVDRLSARFEDIAASLSHHPLVDDDDD